MKNDKELEAGKVMEEEMNGTPYTDTVTTSPDLGEIHSESEADVLEEVDEPHKQADYATFSKKQLVDVVLSLVQEANFRQADAVVKEIKPLFDEMREKERTAALEKYKETSGNEEGFEFRGDDLDQAFYANLKLLRDRRQQHFKSQEEQKAENLRKRQAALENLRAVVEAEDSEHNFHQFKAVQQEWKNLGPVAPAQVKTLWATYSALVDRFYDQRSIYFELKELDRKKNLIAKLELCEKAEKLVNAARVKDAVHELNELHDEFKHIGPVPQTESDAVWHRFKVASDAVYAKRDAYLSELQGELHKNLDTKLKLGEEMAAFATFQSDRIKEWNTKTQEILEVQKKWEAAGAIPRSKAKDVNKKFWSAFKLFFGNKNTFFKKLDEERDKNLAIKNDLIKKALAVQDSNDWNKTANELKELQRLWKETGPVPEKFRERLFKEFKQACDHFFNQRRDQFEKADRDQDQNLKEKELLCAEVEKMAAEKTGSLDRFNELKNKFNALGFVPKNKIGAIKNRFQEATEKLLASLDISSEAKEKALLEIQIGSLKDDPDADRKLYQKEQIIRKRITKAENDIAVLQNNLEFFGRSRSKNADKLREEFNGKIAEATVQLTQLKSQLKMLRAVGQ